MLEHGGAQRVPVRGGPPAGSPRPGRQQRRLAGSLQHRSAEPERRTTCRCPFRSICGRSVDQDYAEEAGAARSALQHRLRRLGRSGAQEVVAAVGELVQVDLSASSRQSRWRWAKSAVLGSSAATTTVTGAASFGAGGVSSASSEVAVGGHAVVPVGGADMPGALRVQLAEGGVAAVRGEPRGDSASVSPDSSVIAARRPSASPSSCAPRNTRRTSTPRSSRAGPSPRRTRCPRSGPTAGRRSPAAGDLGDDLLDDLRPSARTARCSRPGRARAARRRTPQARCPAARRAIGSKFTALPPAYGKQINAPAGARPAPRAAAATRTRRLGGGRRSARPGRRAPGAA